MGNLIQGRSVTDISTQTGKGRVVEIGATGDALHLRTQGGTSDYGPYPARDWTPTQSGTGVNDNDILFAASNLTDYKDHVIHCTVGTVDVEVTVDAINWTDSATNPIAMEDAHATAHATYVTTITAGKVGILHGKFSGVRLRQNGATAATAKMASY